MKDDKERLEIEKERLKTDKEWLEIEKERLKNHTHSDKETLRNWKIKQKGSFGFYIVFIISFFWTW
jgi:hypothetical protein